MDTGTEYIKMCARAEEIQEYYWNAQDGFGKRERDVSITFLESDGPHKDFTYSPMMPGDHELNYPSTWLPRQDQLQEMLKEIYEFKLCAEYQMVYHFQKFTEKCKFIDWSMEQLWLAFVMKEKYQKTWAGTDWIKEGYVK